MKLLTNLSSYKTADTEDQLSVEYQNLYAIEGVIYYFTLVDVKLPSVNKFTNSYTWAPVVKIFNSEQDIEQYLAAHKDKVEVELATLGDNLWYGNIGHALWDGLYPLYLALIKFGYTDSPFTLLSSDWSNKETMAYDIVTKFSGNHLLEYLQLDKSKIFYFKTLVAGTGNTGNRIINKEYTLYGENEYKALSFFKQRLLRAYDISIDKAINKRLKAIIIRNKRFNDYEATVVQKVVEYYKDTIDIKYIDWYHGYNSFTAQLKELEDVDIHITGPGTGMMYMPLLKKGAVNVNLGYMEHTQTNTSRPNIFVKGSTAEDHLLPGWMEQSVCAATTDVTTLYYDRITHNYLEIGPMVELINQAISIATNNIILNNKHNLDALVFKEYCKRVENADAVCSYLTGIAFFIELFINEHPAATPSPLVDLELLRKIKDELGYSRKYQIEL